MVVTETQQKKTGRIRSKRVSLILKAAETAFASHGFRGATVQGIADLADLPKPNVLYYFNNKQELYEAVLTNILDLWNRELNDIRITDDPATSLEKYIRSKVEVSRKYPTACRIFTTEVIHGSHQLSPVMKKSTQNWVNDKVAIMQTWIDQGRMRPVDPMYLLFLIWGSTQHYADYESQICSIMNKKKLTRSTYDQAADEICDVVLRGCGLRE